MSDMIKIVTHIEKVLDHLPLITSERILLKVPNHLRRVKNEAYEPDIISIGPYHRGKDHLAAMEEHKFRYLKLLLQRRGENSIAKYVKALNKLNERAKNCYEKQFLEERRPDDFLETMMVDGCFIVELIRKSELIRKGVAKNMSTADTIFGSKMTLYSLKHDLLLLENQLPFFVLQKLFDITSLPNEEGNLVKMILRFFNMILPGPGYPRIEHNLPKVPARHLLGLIHDNWLPTPKGVNDYLENERNNRPIIIPCSAGYQCSPEYTEQIPSLFAEHTQQRPLLSLSPENIEQRPLLSLSAEPIEQRPLLSAAYPKQIPSLSAEYTEEIKGPIDSGFIRGKEASKEDDAEPHIRCATELHDAGIKFKRAEAKGCSIFDIKFAKGVLEIPKYTEETPSLSAEYTEQIPSSSVSSAMYTDQSAMYNEETTLLSSAVYTEEIPSLSAVYTEQIPSLSTEYTEQIPSFLKESAMYNEEITLLSTEYTEQIQSSLKESAMYNEEITLLSIEDIEQIPLLSAPSLSTAYPEEIKRPIDSSFIRGKEASKEDDAEAHIRCATELHEAGIKFKRAEAKECRIFDIIFAKGVLEIPKLTIQDRTESLLRNLIAYEQFSKDDIYQVTDYAKFMDCLINSEKDVELLRHSGIIDNWLGDDKVIASMFNRLLDNVVVHKRSFYSEIYIKVNKHCGRKWNSWKAILRHDYFNSPWALISFSAAVFLLLLTVLQTVYSVLSYYHS